MNWHDALFTNFKGKLERKHMFFGTILGQVSFFFFFSVLEDRLEKKVNIS